MSAFEQQLIEQARAGSRPLEPISTGLEPRLPKLDDIQAVLFDIYGTLLVSGSGDVGTAQEQSDQNAFSKSLTDAGLGDVPGLDGPEEILKTLHAEHARRKAEGIEFPEVEIRNIWKEALTRLSVTANAEAVSVAVMAYELRTNCVWPMPGTRRTLDAIKEKGLPLGIVSNAQFYTPLILSALLGDIHGDLGFDRALCSWSYKLGEGKPSPRLFKGVVAELQARNIRPGQALYVGNDMLNDIYTATEAGFRTVLFAGDQRSLRLRESDPRCTNLEPDGVVTRLEQLQQVV